MTNNLLSRLTNEIAGQLERRTVERDSHPEASKEWFYLEEQANTLRNVLQDMRYALENGVTRLEFMRAVALNSPVPEPTPRIVCLCGPTRFREAYRRANAHFTLQGCIVLSCGVFKGDPEWGEEAKVDLDELHLRKIELADEVCIIGGEAQAGESTRREIAYASRHGQHITNWSITAYL